MSKPWMFRVLAASAFVAYAYYTRRQHPHVKADKAGSAEGPSPYSGARAN